MADVVIGSRYCEGGRVANWPVRRRLLSRFANDYVRRITGLRARDATSGFRCYTQRALRRLLDGRVAAEGYAFLVEAVFHAHREGLAVAEVPIKLSESPAYIGGRIDRGAPMYGEDNEYVYGELLGMSTKEIEQLAADGVF